MRQYCIPILFSSLLVLSLGVASCGSASTPATVPTEPQLRTASDEPETLPTDTTVPEPTAEVLALTDGRGEEVRLEGPPGRIVSIAPSNVELLFAIGAGDLLVGRDELTDYPPEALEIENIGTPYGQLNTEAVVALEPDLVLAADINPPEQVAAVEDLGIPVFVVPNPLVFQDLYDNITALGKLTGHAQKAAELNASLSDRVERIVDALAEAEPVSVYYEIDGTDPTAPWTTGGGTFQDYLITQAGGDNIAADLDMWQTISLEEIVTRDPQVIVFEVGPFIPTTADSLGERAGWSDIAAVQNGRIYGVDTNLTGRPGPRLVDGLEKLAEMLHPELFAD
jgi:iron complex transport system substrate-binding protein